jgi:hypothetical protein
MTQICKNDENCYSLLNSYISRNYKRGRMLVKKSVWFVGAISGHTKGLSKNVFNGIYKP